MSEQVQTALEDIKSQVNAAIQKANAAAENGEKYSKGLEADIKSLNEQMKDIQAAQAEMSQNGDIHQEELKSFGEQLVSKMNLKSDGRVSAQIEGKAAASPVLSAAHDSVNGSGVIQGQRLAGVVSDPLERLTIVDAMTRMPTSAPSIEYVQEVNTTLNAGMQTEGGSKPESQFDFQLKSIHVGTVAHFTRISKQFRDDAPYLVSLINNRMLFGVRQKLNAEIIAGNGSVPNINGLIGVSGNHTAFTPTASENRFDAIRRMIAAVEDAEFNATTVIMNPADVLLLDLLKDSNQNYVASNPRSGLNAVAWGRPIVTSKKVAPGKAIVADMANACTLWDREQVGVEMFEQDGDNVTKNLLTIRAEGRFQVTAEHPKAIVYGDLLSA